MDIKSIITKSICSHVDMNEAEVYELIETPPERDMGDYGVPCFRFA